MKTAPLAMVNSVSKSPLTRLLHKCPNNLLTMLESKLHLVEKRKSSMTVLRILMRQRKRSRDLKKTKAKSSTAQQENAIERPPTTLHLLSVNRNVTRKSAKPNNKGKRFTSRLRLRNKGSL